MRTFRSSWNRIWRALGTQPPTGLFERLLCAYAEPHRKYHTLQHLRECLDNLDRVHLPMASRPEIEAALWFHDAIYDVRRSDNESRSALWAQQELLVAGESIAHRVHELIMVTRHFALPASPEEKLVVDIDLAILGADTARYREYEDQIRQEYAWVSEEQFRRARCDILAGLLARPCIFSTPPFHDDLERSARANLEQSLADLSR